MQPVLWVKQNRRQSLRIMYKRKERILGCKEDGPYAGSWPKTTEKGKGTKEGHDGESAVG